MSDINTNATVDVNINGQQAKNELDALKRRASDLKNAIAKAAKAGEWKEEKSLHLLLNETNRQIRNIQSSAQNVETTLRRLDKASPGELRQTLIILNRQMRNMERGSTAWEAHAEKIREVKKELAEVNRSLNSFSEVGVKGFIERWQSLLVGSPVIMKMVSGWFEGAVGAYAELDSAMANTQKFTGMSRDKVESLNAEFNRMDTRTPTEGLHELAQAAGRLGKSSEEEVMGFVRAGDIIGVAMDELGSDAPEIISKLAGIFDLEPKMGTEQAMLSVGSAINTLSQNYAAATPSLVDFASRMGATASQTNMAMHEMLAFGTLLDANGVSIEKSATALQGVISKMYAAPATFARKAGLDVTAFTEALQRSSTEGVMMFVESLSQMNQMELNATLADLGTAGAGVTQTFQTLAGKSGDLKRVLSDSAMAFENATSATEEFNVQNNTLEARLDKAKKGFRGLVTELGKQLLPLMEEGLSLSGGAVSVLGTILRFVGENKGAIIGLGAAIGSYTIGVKLATLSTGAMSGASGVLKVATLALTGQFGKAKTALIALNTTMKLSPWGLAATAILAVGAAVYKLATNTDEYKKKLDDAMRGVMGFSAETQKEQSELDKLFGTLEGAKKGTKEYNTAKESIISRYGAYLQGLINEKGEINDLEGAYNRLTIAIRRNSVEKGLENARSGVVDSWMSAQSEALTELQERFEIWGVPTREAARLTQEVASAMARGEKVPDNVKDLIAQYEDDLGPSVLDSKNIEDFTKRLGTSTAAKVWVGTVSPAAGVKLHQEAYESPLALIEKLEGKLDMYNESMASVDLMAKAAMPLRDLDTKQLGRVAKALEKVVATGDESKVYKLPNGVARSLGVSVVTVADARKWLDEVETERVARGESSPSSTNPDTVVDKKCPKCGKIPCACKQVDDEPKKERFASEKAWRERMDLENKLAMRRGLKDYEEYMDDKENIEEQYYIRVLARKDLTESERLKMETELEDARAKQDERAAKQDIELVERTYQEQMRIAKQSYLEGILDAETFKDETVRIELERQRALLLLTKAGSDERTTAEQKYQDALVAEKSRQEAKDKSNQDKKAKADKEITDMRRKYFGLTAKEVSEVEANARKALDDAYNWELTAVGDDAEAIKKIKEQYAAALAAMEKEFADPSWLDKVKGRIGSTPFDGLIEMLLPETMDEDMKTTIMNFASSAYEIYGSVTDMMVAETEIQIAAIERRYEKEISLAEGNANKVKALEKQKERDIAKAKSDANRKQFAMQVIQATAQTAQNAIAAYGSAAAIPLTGHILAPIAAAAAIAAGMLQIAAIKKQQQASESQGYWMGGFTPSGGMYEPAGIVHKGEWVASQKLLASPVARPMIDALDYAQRTNTIGMLKAQDVSRSITAPAVIASSSSGTAVSESITAQSTALADYTSVIRRLNARLDEPFVTINTVTGDAGIKAAQDEYEKLINNKRPKNRKK